jgi:hypothetical protein
VLYDADDCDKFVMGEDAMLAFYRYLGQKLRADGLLQEEVSGKGKA